MQLHSARVTGFQSFADTGEMEFGEGINLIVGQNNAGKSALLRGLQLDIAGDRHRNPAAWIDAALPRPTTAFSIDVSGEEIKTAVFELNGQVIVPAPAQGGVNVVAYVEELLSRNVIRFALTRRAAEAFTALTYPSHANFQHPGHGYQTAARIVPHNGELSFSVHNNGEDSLPNIVAHLWQTRMFYFSAERFGFGRTNVSYVKRLDHAAANLAAFLNTLSGDRGDVFRKLVLHLREIFPSVGNLSTRVSPDNQQFVEVRVWPTEAQERPELSFPLSQSGTGVAQVIALLSSVMTVDKAVILIDEINSFLHPSAVKTLLRILQTEYSHHQYIVSTHAPEVIGFSNPSSIHLVKRSGYNSSVESLDVSSVSTLKDVASHLGVSLADVFAADHVIWVEGETEELIFPYIFQQMAGALPRGTVFTTVAATGDFGAKRRDRAMVFEAYSRLSGAVATMPVRVSFGFDTETLSEAEKAELVRASAGRLHFLPRRHLECFFLHPEAITERMSSLDAEQSYVLDEVKAKIKEIGSRREFSLPEIEPDLNDLEWLSRVNAARLLSLLFQEMSDGRLAYDKKSDGLAIVQIVLGKDVRFFQPLLNYIQELVDRAREPVMD